MEESGPEFIGPRGSNFFPGGGGPIAYSYIDLKNVRFTGVGSGPPAPFSGAARGMVNWVRPHILVIRHSMTLTPLVQVLLTLGYYATGSYCLEIGYTLGYQMTPRLG